MLSEQESNALERLRSHEADESDYETLAYALAAGYPPGWNDPVTPERLVELGGTETEHEGSDKIHWIRFLNGSGSSILDIVFYRDEIDEIDEVDVGGRLKKVCLPSHLFPRNMKEARELLVRCGAIKEDTNEN